MLKLTCIPTPIRHHIEPLRSQFNYHHFLTFSWLLVMQILFQGQANLKALSRHMPIPYYLLPRLLSASYWYTPRLWIWFVNKVLSVVPPPLDRVCYVIADSTVKPKRGKLNPLNKKSKKSADEPSGWLFGLHIIVLSLHWSGWRIPIAFTLIRQKDDPLYLNENELFRQMLKQATIPTWAETVVVTADAAYASKENFKLIQALGWYYVIACAKTWNLADGTPLKSRLLKLQRNQFKPTWIPSMNGKRRRFFHVRIERHTLKHLGDVTVVFSKTRRNTEPKKTKVLLTNLPLHVTVRDILLIYQRRWNTEVLFKELKSGVGLGEHQVTKDIGRIERSVAMAFFAYLFLLRWHVEQQGKTHWSLFDAKHRFTWIVAKEHFSNSKQKYHSNTGKDRLIA